MSYRINIDYSSILVTICVAFVASTVIQVRAFEIVDCNKDVPDVIAKLGQITINGCAPSADSQNASCIMERGTNMSIGVDFVPTTVLDSVKVKISGKIHGVPLPFPVRPDEACGNYGLKCPLKANEKASFQLLLPVLKQYPKLHVDVVLELKDSSRRPMVCLSFPANIQDKLKH